MLRVDLEQRHGYLYAALSGELDISGAQAAYREVLQAAVGRKQPRIMMDCTRISGTFTTADRMAFGAFMAEEQQRQASHMPEPPRVAILAVPPLMDPGRFTQTVANNRGVRMRASESFQELISWLGL